MKLKTGQIVKSPTRGRYYKLLRNKGNNRFYCLVRGFAGGEYEDYIDFNNFKIDKFNPLIILNHSDSQDIALLTLSDAINTYEFFITK